MSTMLEQLHSDNDDENSGRVAELERKLNHVQNAFDEYVATTQIMESDMSKELKRLQSKLKRSATTNDMLKKEIEESTERLKTESKIRRRIETKHLELESRHEALQARSKNLSFNHHIERNDSTPLVRLDSGMVTEMTSNTSRGIVVGGGRRIARNSSQELETVQEQFDDTQQHKLEQVEKELEQSQSRVKELENLLKAGRETQAEYSMSPLRSTQSNMEEAYQDRGRLLNENAMLLEELSCLREILYEQEVGLTAMDGELTTVSKSIKNDKELEQEIIDLREKFEVVRSEKSVLQEKLSRLQNEQAHTSDTATDNEQATHEQLEELKCEVEELNNELNLVHDEHERSMKESELFWKNEFEKKSKPKKEDNEYAELRLEVLTLTQSLYDAQQHNISLEVALQNEEERLVRNSLNKVYNKSYVQKLENDLSDSKNDVEARKKENNLLEDELNSEKAKIRMLSEEISQMNVEFEKAQEDYSKVVEELDVVRERLQQPRQETMANNFDDDVHYSNIKRRNTEIEEEKQNMMLQLDKASSDNVLLQKKLNESIQKIIKSRKLSSSETNDEQLTVVQRETKELKWKLEEAEKTLELFAARDLKKADELMERKNAERVAEISLLRSQFTKLLEKNQTIEEKVSGTEIDIVSLKEATKTRADVANELQEEIDRVVHLVKSRTHEMDELTNTIENRMNIVENEFLLSKESESSSVHQSSRYLDTNNERKESLLPLSETKVAGDSDINNFGSNDLDSEINSTQLPMYRSGKEKIRSNDWLMDQYQTGKDENIKAAIAATMAYVTAADGVSSTESKQESLSEENLKPVSSPFEDTDMSHDVVQTNRESKTLSQNNCNARASMVKTDVDRVKVQSFRNEREIRHMISDVNKIVSAFKDVERLSMPKLTTVNAHGYFEVRQRENVQFEESRGDVDVEVRE